MAHLKPWVWMDNALVDGEGRKLADVRANVLHIGQERFLVESVLGRMTFRLRATASDGKSMRLIKKGFGVGLLLASADGVTYHLRRINPFGRAREIFAVGEASGLIRTRPHQDGRLEISGAEAFPLKHSAFLSYACALLDGPGVLLQA